MFYNESCSKCSESSHLSVNNPAGSGLLVKYETSHLVCTYLSNYTTWKQVEKREWCNKGVSCGKCVMYKGSNDEDVAHEQIYREKTSSVVGGDHW